MAVSAASNVGRDRRLHSTELLRLARQDAARQRRCVVQVMEFQDVVELMRMEYAEMPELKLTLRQAQRLWNVSTALCERALETLAGSGFLVRTPDGAYIRRTA